MTRPLTCVYDNPTTQSRECWQDGVLIYAVKMPLLQGQGKWPPPAHLFFFGANVGDWKEGQIIGDFNATKREQNND